MTSRNRAQEVYESEEWAKLGKSLSMADKQIVTELVKQSMSRIKNSKVVQTYASALCAQYFLIFFAYFRVRMTKNKLPISCSWHATTEIRTSKRANLLLRPQVPWMAWLSESFPLLVIHWQTLHYLLDENKETSDRE